MDQRLPSGRYEGSILLADISGYTSFLNSVKIAHASDAFADGQIPDAYAMMSSFLEGIAARVDPPFTLIKFEGDAVFAVAPDDESPHAGAMIDCVADCYADFVDRLSAAREIWTCSCEACIRKDTLDLKFILHFGEFFIQVVGRQVDAVGPEVNVAHRLLKNDAVGLVGALGYGLFTEEIVEALELPLEHAVRLTETVDDGRQVVARVIPLHV